MTQQETCFCCGFSSSIHRTDGAPHRFTKKNIAQERVFLLPEFCHLTGLDEDTSHHKTRCFDEISAEEVKLLLFFCLDWEF